MVSCCFVNECINEGDTLSIMNNIDNIKKPNVLLEDYSDDNDVLKNLRESFLKRDKKVSRIAFMGDSFIEGDLITTDVRESLQNSFGGGGVGFVPVTSIVSEIRPTVKHKYRGWNSHAIKRRNTSEIDSMFTLSGYLFSAVCDSATVTYNTTKYRKYLNNVTDISFVFVNKGNTTIDVVVNDTIKLNFKPDSSDDIQNIDIKHNNINSISFKIKNGKGFYAYGVFMDGNRGVAVDNFSDRGSSGLSFVKLTEDYNTRFNDILNYNLIVVEFGVNVIQRDVRSYKSFENKMVDIINKLKLMYPSADIVIMGVADRSVKEQDTYITMPEVESMIEHQRNIAKRCKVAFFDVYKSMGGKNSMITFVDKKWAAKDYTHIVFSGAKIIANAFVDALLYELKLKANN